MDRRENDRRYRSRAEMLRDRRRRRKRTCLIELLIVLFFYHCSCRCGRYICMEKIWSIEGES